MSAAPPVPAPFEYVVQQLPPNVAASAKNQGSVLATYLTQYMNQMAVSGWEFFRMDTMSETTPPGCLGLFGGPVTRHFAVVTFRRPRHQAPASTP
jgi:hypothetical protein